MSNEKSRYVIVCTFFHGTGREVIDQQFIECETYEDAVKQEAEFRKSYDEAYGSDGYEIFISEY